MQIFIYALIDPRNNQIRYIGQTNNIKRRYTKHLTDSRNIKRPNKNHSWIKSLLNLNLKPEQIILDVVEFHEWEFWEKHYISLYKSWGFKLNNHTEGGGNVGYNYKQKDKILLIMSQKAKARMSNPINNPMYNKTHNSSSKKLQSISHKGKKLGELNSRARAILQYDLQLNFIKEWTCAKYCADEYKLSRGNMSSATAHNMEVDIHNNIIQNKINEYKQYITNDNYDEYSIIISNLKTQIRKHKQVKGFIFKYK